MPKETNINERRKYSAERLSKRSAGQPRFQVAGKPHAFGSNSAGTREGGGGERGVEQNRPHGT